MEPKVFTIVEALITKCVTNLDRDLDLLYERALGERDLDLEADLALLPFLSGDFYKNTIW